MIAPMTKCKTPSRLFNELEDHFGVDSRAKVAHILKVSPQRMNQIRVGKTPMSGNFILAIYDATGWSIEKIRDLAGVNK